MELSLQELWVARENIARFQHKLLNESDVSKRNVLEELLASEESKLSGPPKVRASMTTLG